jgi:hypothetical protein
MTNDPKHDGGGLEADSDQALWKLLGQARPVEVSPYFVRRVLRDLDAGGAVADGAASRWRSWWRPGWMFAGSGAVAAVVIGIFSFSSIPVAQPPSALHRQVASAAPATQAAQAVQPEAAAAPNTVAAVAEVPDDVSPQDVDVIADLDNLVAREETNVWTDDTSRF